MSDGLIVLLLVIVFGIFVAIMIGPWLIRTYNVFVLGKNKIQELWSNVEVQLKRRYDLIPNIVSTVKGYAKHEDTVFTQVTEARSQAMTAATPAQHQQFDARLMGGLASLYAVAEAYPDLKASTQFQGLQEQLREVEDGIEEARTAYNAGVSRFNTLVQKFPNNLLAGLFGVTAAEFYNAPAEADDVVSVTL